jgi:hypothetical protein
LINTLKVLLGTAKHIKENVLAPKKLSIYASELKYFDLKYYPIKINIVLVNPDTT